MRASIKLKFAVTFTIISALAAMVAWLGVMSLRSSNDALLDLVNGPVARLQRADELRLAIMNIAPAEKNMVMAATPNSRGTERWGAEAAQPGSMPRASAWLT